MAFIPGMIQMFGDGIDVYRLHGSGAVRHLAPLEQFGTPRGVQVEAAVGQKVAVAPADRFVVGIGRGQRLGVGNIGIGDERDNLVHQGLKFGDPGGGGPGGEAAGNIGGRVRQAAPEDGPGFMGQAPHTQSRDIVVHQGGGLGGIEAPVHVPTGLPGRHAGPSR